MPSFPMPSEIHIGTRNFFLRGDQYVYRWDLTHKLFMCEKTTDAGITGEKLAFMTQESATGNWYVAVEGRLVASGFEVRRPAFRTQSEFWRAGWHEWQVNQIVSGRDVDWAAPGCLHAMTKVPSDAGTVDLLEGLQQLALTD